MNNTKKKYMLDTIILFFGLIMAMPFIWMILSSFKTETELMQVPPSFFPEILNWQNYGDIMYNIPFLLFYRNTIIITLMRTAAQVLFCSMAAFAFAKIPFKGKEIIFLSLLSVLMIPPQMILVPNYMIMRNLGLIDTLTGVALPGMFSAFGMFLLRQFYMTLPDELMDAGKIDGCSYFMIFRKLLFPLTKAAVMALVIFTVMYSWNDLLWPLIISSSDETRVLSVGIALMQGQNRIFYNQIMAGAVMATLPVLLIFTLLQKYFVAGIAMTGLKG